MAVEQPDNTKYHQPDLGKSKRATHEHVQNSVNTDKEQRDSYAGSYSLTRTGKTRLGLIALYSTTIFNPTSCIPLCDVHQGKCAIGGFTMSLEENTPDGADGTDER